MNYKLYGIIAALCLVAFSAGRFSSPQSKETKETDKITQEQVKNTDQDQNVVVTTKETKSPDGTIITETRKETETKTETQVQTNSETTKSLDTKVESRPAYRLGVAYDPAIKDFQDSYYAVTIEKRMFSEVYMGIQVSSLHTIGLTASLGF